MKTKRSSMEYWQAIANPSDSMCNCIFCNFGRTSTVTDGFTCNVQNQGACHTTRRDDDGMRAYNRLHASVENCSRSASSCSTAKFCDLKSTAATRHDSGGTARHIISRSTEVSQLRCRYWNDSVESPLVPCNVSLALPHDRDSFWTCGGGHVMNLIPPSRISNTISSSWQFEAMLESAEKGPSYLAASEQKARKYHDHNACVGISSGPVPTENTVNVPTSYYVETGGSSNPSKPQWKRCRMLQKKRVSRPGFASAWRTWLHLLLMLVYFLLHHKKIQFVHGSRIYSASSSHSYHKMKISGTSSPKEIHNLVLNSQEETSKTDEGHLINVDVMRVRGYMDPKISGGVTEKKWRGSGGDWIIRWRRVLVASVHQLLARSTLTKRIQANVNIPNPGNVVKNPSFEDNPRIDPWIVPKSGMPNVMIYEPFSFDGEVSIQIGGCSSPLEVSTCLQGVLQQDNIPTEKGSKYRLSLYVRGMVDGRKKNLAVGVWTGGDPKEWNVGIDTGAVNGDMFQFVAIDFIAENELTIVWMSYVTVEVNSVVVDAVSLVRLDDAIIPPVSPPVFPLSPTRQLILLGSANVSSSKLALTPPSSYILENVTQTGLAFISSRFKLLSTPSTSSSSSSCSSASFHANFTFQISSHPQSSTPRLSHGFAFVLSPDPSMGRKGPHLGYSRICNGYLDSTSSSSSSSSSFSSSSSSSSSYAACAPSIAVEFDMHKDDFLNDINDNHVGVNLNFRSVSAVVADATLPPASLKMADGGVHEAQVVYHSSSGTLSVFLRSLSSSGTNRSGQAGAKREALLVAPMDLCSLFSSSKSALDGLFVGFSASGDAVNHDILSWSFEASEFSVLDSSSPQPTPPLRNAIQNPSFESFLPTGALFISAPDATSLPHWQITSGRAAFLPSPLSLRAGGLSGDGGDSGSPILSPIPLTLPAFSGTSSLILASCSPATIVSSLITASSTSPPAESTPTQTLCTSGGISQQFPTEIGKEYELRFFVHGDAGMLLNVSVNSIWRYVDFSAAPSAAPLGSRAAGSMGAVGTSFHQASIRFNASVTASAITFFANASSTLHLQQIVAIDDVTVLPVIRTIESPKFSLTSFSSLASSSSSASSSSALSLAGSASLFASALSPKSSSILLNLATPSSSGLVLNPLPFSLTSSSSSPNSTQSTYHFTHSATENSSPTSSATPPSRSPSSSFSPPPSATSFSPNSFSTSFSFQRIPSNISSASSFGGIAFVLLQDPTPGSATSFNSSEPEIGLTRSCLSGSDCSPALAVAFYPSSGEDSLNVSLLLYSPPPPSATFSPPSLQMLASTTTDPSTLSLSPPTTTFSAWVQYDANVSAIFVWLSASTHASPASSLPRPSKPLLVSPLNLLQTFSSSSSSSSPSSPSSSDGSVNTAGSQATEGGPSQELGSSHPPLLFGLSSSSGSCLSSSSSSSSYSCTSHVLLSWSFRLGVSQVEPLPPPPSTPKKKKKAEPSILFVVGASLGAIACTTLLLLFLLCCCFRPYSTNSFSFSFSFMSCRPKHSLSTLEKEEDEEEREEWGRKEGEAESRFKQFSIAEVSRATGEFSRACQIAKGRTADVFRGKGRLSSEWAVKRLRTSQASDTGLAERTFMKEAFRVSGLRHPNMVPVEGYCKDAGERILIYHFMPNGSIKDHLHVFSEGETLSFVKRLNIALGMAEALFFLHSHPDGPFTHANLTPSNILLTHSFEAKLQDMASVSLSIDGGYLGVEDELGEEADNEMWRKGYVDPEMILRSSATPQNDVFSFGVILLELLTGRIAVTKDPDDPSTNLMITTWAVHYIKERQLQLIVDPRIMAPNLNSCFLKFGRLAVDCVQVPGSARPTMREVLERLRKVESMAVLRTVGSKAGMNEGGAEGMKRKGRKKKLHTVAETDASSTSSSSQSASTLPL